MDRLQSWLANVCYMIGGVVFLPVLLYRMAFSGRYRRGWAHRLGFVPLRCTDRPVIWIHAVSVGEVNATRTLVDRLRQQLPLYEIYVSVTTDTGYDRACALYGRDNVMFYPFDLTFTMGPALRRLRPALIILMELEVWFNLVLLASRFEPKIPVMVANGRITQRSVQRYGWVRWFAKGMFDRLALVLAQDETYGRRFSQLGVPVERIATVGSLKWDTATVAEAVEGADQLASAMGIDPDRPLLVAGSTGQETEEEAILRAYRQVWVHHDRLQLAIVPRKPERFEVVAKLIRARGFEVVRRSRHADGSPGGGLVAGRPVVFLGDTMGELRKFYSLATVVFVGRSLVPMGGSDVMEVAGLGKPMVFGPFMDNFAEAAEKLLEADAAVRVEKEEKLAATVDELLADAERLQRMSHAARQVVLANQGATARTVERVCQVLGMEYDRTERAVATPRLQC